MHGLRAGHGKMDSELCINRHCVLVVFFFFVFFLLLRFFFGQIGTAGPPSNRTVYFRALDQAMCVRLHTVGVVCVRARVRIDLHIACDQAC